MDNTTLLISTGLIAGGLFLAYKIYRPKRPPAAKPAKAMDQLMTVKSQKSQSSVVGDSRPTAGKKGMLNN